MQRDIEGVPPQSKSPVLHSPIWVASHQIPIRVVLGTSTGITGTPGSSVTALLQAAFSSRYRARGGVVGPERASGRADGGFPQGLARPQALTRSPTTPGLFVY